LLYEKVTVSASLGINLPFVKLLKSFHTWKEAT